MSEQTQYDQTYLNIYSQTKDKLQTRNERSEQLTHLRSYRKHSGLRSE